MTAIVTSFTISGPFLRPRGALRERRLKSLSPALPGRLRSFIRFFRGPFARDIGAVAEGRTVWSWQALPSAWPGFLLRGRLKGVAPAPIPLTHIYLEASPPSNRSAVRKRADRLRAFDATSSLEGVIGFLVSTFSTVDSLSVVLTSRSSMEW